MLNGDPKGVMPTYRRHPLPSTCFTWEYMDEDERDSAAAAHLHYRREEGRR